MVYGDRPVELQYTESFPNIDYDKWGKTEFINSSTCSLYMQIEYKSRKNYLPNFTLKESYWVVVVIVIVVFVIIGGGDGVGCSEEAMVMVVIVVGMTVVVG